MTTPYSDLIYDSHLNWAISLDVVSPLRFVDFWGSLLFTKEEKKRKEKFKFPNEDRPGFSLAYLLIWQTYCSVNCYSPKNEPMCCRIEQFDEQYSLEGNLDSLKIQVLEPFSMPLPKDSLVVLHTKRNILVKKRMK